jgi:2-hydroxymethylglutarate dehydrogenase
MADVVSQGQVSARVGFIGVGAMGSHMVVRLLAAGHSVTAFDVDDELLRRTADAGATTVSSPGAVARAADVIFLSLPSPAIVKRVVEEPDGVVSGLLPGAVVVDLSTTDPPTSRAVAAAVHEAGGRYLDAPVSGGIMGASNGTLTLMVGGDGAVLEDVRSLLACLGERIVHCGPTGTGQTAKLCNNMLCAANLAAISETFLTGVKAGLEPEVLLEIVRHSSGDSWLLDEWFPSCAFRGDFTPRFKLDLMHKDVSLFAATAAELDAPTPVCAAAREMFRAARVAGLGDRDMTALVLVYEQLAGIQLAER